MSTVDDVRLQQLLDRTEISDVQSRYAAGNDDHDRELLRSCFTDDIEVDFSSGFGLAVQHLSADEWTIHKPLVRALEATHHTITNHVITFDDDDHATCIAYLHAVHHNPNLTGDDDQTVDGYYANRYVRTEQGWRIATLRLVVKWMRGNAGLFAGVLDRAE